jgi:type IV secretion system protein TrbB
MSTELATTFDQQTNSTRVLEAQFAPLEDYIKDPSVTDLMINSDGSVWIDNGRGSPKSIDVTLTKAHRFSIIHELAGYHDLICARESPTLACRLPAFWEGCGGRVNAIVPPISDAPEMCIRFPSRVKLSLEDLVAKKTLTRLQARQLRRCVREKRNIVIAGGTGSGKTTLANALLDLITDERLGIIEDTPEIFLNNKNTYYWATTATFSARDAVKASLRHRPDRIILGEVRDSAALDWCKAAQSGHPGSVCTVHASSAAGVHSRIYSLMQEVVVTPSDELIDSAIDVTVFMDRVTTRSNATVRKVQEILDSSKTSLKELT